MNFSVYLDEESRQISCLRDFFETKNGRVTAQGLGMLGQASDRGRDSSGGPDFRRRMPEPQFFADARFAAAER
jgi:hypothetical protein